jgi:uncharacterized protein YbbC (DUF1343 family)
MRSLNAALLYPGIGMLEYAKVYSVGRGTDAPFEQVGAAWMRSRELARYLNSRALPGVRVYPARLTPTASYFAGQSIDGVRFVITDRDAFNSTRFGIEVGVALAKLFPGSMQFEGNEKLAGSRELLKAMEAASDPATILTRDRAALDAYLARRLRFLLY